MSLLNGCPYLLMQLALVDHPRVHPFGQTRLHQT